MTNSTRFLISILGLAASLVCVVMVGQVAVDAGWDWTTPFLLLSVAGWLCFAHDAARNAKKALSSEDEV